MGMRFPKNRLCYVLVVRVLASMHIPAVPGHSGRGVSFIGGNRVVSPVAKIAGKLGVNIFVKIKFDFGNLLPNRHKLIQAGN